MDDLANQALFLLDDTLGKINQKQLRHFTSLDTYIMESLESPKAAPQSPPIPQSPRRKQPSKVSLQKDQMETLLKSLQELRNRMKQGKLRSSRVLRADLKKES